MRAGELRYRWEVLKRAVTRSSKGEEITNWHAVSTIWGSFDPLKGSEAWSAHQAVERAVARVRVRHNPSITAMHRIRNSELGEFEILGEPEHRKKDGETVLQISRIVER